MRGILSNFSLIIIILVIFNDAISEEYVEECSKLSPFQYLCKNYPVDPITQQSVTCAPDNSIQVMCETAPYLKCIGKDEYGIFNMTIPDGCQFGAHLSFSTAVLLSIFLGFFGVDRIYLGYYAIGLLKMFSLGGLFVFWLVDIILISLQLLIPADGTSYVMPYYGPKISPLR